MKIKINDGLEFGIDLYNRFSNATGNIKSMANIAFSDMSVYDEFAAFQETPIEDIKIFDDEGKQIYHLANQNAIVTSINENIVNGTAPKINATLAFMVKE